MARKHPEEYTSIAIKKPILRRLTLLKVHPYQPVNEVIEQVLNYYESQNHIKKENRKVYKA